MADSTLDAVKTGGELVCAGACPRRLWHFAAMLACGSALLLAGCKQAPEPRYEGPHGQGRLVFEPGRGIVRQGSIASSDEQALFSAVQRAFAGRKFAECILFSEQLGLAFPEGSRVVETVLLRVQARLELGRAEEGGLPRSVPLNQLLFVYLAPDDDARLRALMARDPSVASYARDFRAADISDFARRLQPDAKALVASGQLAGALNDCRMLVTYYLPAQELREFRMQTAELTRDVAWLAFAAAEYNNVLEITEELLAMNPPPVVKGDTLFIRGNAQIRTGAHAFAADTFEQLFRGSNLRDTDTRWRPYALALWIQEIMATSKGPLYDVVPYERALELVGEYELYRIENPNLPAKLRDIFTALAERAFDVLIYRASNAADAYSRLGQSQARDHYLENAKLLEAERDQRLARLKGGS